MNYLENKFKTLSESINQKPIWFLLILVLINISLKLFQISDASIWLDESHTATQSLKDVSSIISESAHDQNPPAYFILMHFWTSIFGISEFGIRLFSLCLSIFTAILLFLFSRKYFNIKVALISSLLFTFSEQQIYFSLEARSYALIGAFCMLSFSTFLKLLNKPAIKTSLLLGFINAFIIYSHFISCFIILVQLLFAVLYSINHGGKIFLMMLLATSVTTILFIPWIGNLINNAPQSGVYWLTRPTFYNLKGLFISFSNGKITTVFFAFIIFTFLTLEIKKYLNEKKLSEKNYQFLLLLLWFLLPVIADYCLCGITPIFLNKYLLYSSLGLYLLIGFCLSELLINERLRMVLIALTLILFIINSKIQVKKTEDWRGTAGYIKTILKPGEVCLLSSACISMPFSYYYDRTIFTNYKRQTELLNAKKIFPTDKLNDEKLNEFNSQENLILIESHAINGNTEESPLKVIERRYHPVSEKNFGDINVFVFEKQSAP